MTILDATDHDFKDLLSRIDGRILLDFWAPSCPPCIDIGKRLRELAPAYEGAIQIIKVNADDNPETAIEFGVRGLPTLVLLKHGKEHKRHIGGLNQAKLDALLKDWTTA